MNLTLRTPSLIGDWLRPEALLGRDFFDFENEFFVPRLGVTVPSVNIRETEKEFLFDMAAPGLERKDFNIELDHHVLTISAEKETKKEGKENGYSRKEYSFNSFSRAFTLPDNIKEGAIDAKYENGVLQVHIPKAKETPSPAAKKISVG
jgi:HSP20 family protein